MTPLTNYARYVKCLGVALVVQELQVNLVIKYIHLLG